MIAIVNVTNGWGIGNNGQLNIHIKSDLRRFKELTTGNPILLGRKTLETFPNGKPLPNRENLILTKNPDFSVPGARVLHSKEAVFEAEHRFDDDIIVVGGESIYHQFLPFCRKLYLTQTFLDIMSDAFFPDISIMSNWKCFRESDMMEENGVQFKFYEFINEAPVRF